MLLFSAHVCCAHPRQHICSHTRCGSRSPAVLSGPSQQLFHLVRTVGCQQRLQWLLACRHFLYSTHAFDLSFPLITHAGQRCRPDFLDGSASGSIRDWNLINYAFSRGTACPNRADEPQLTLGEQVRMLYCSTVTVPMNRRLRGA